AHSSAPVPFPATWRFWLKHWKLVSFYCVYRMSHANFGFAGSLTSGLPMSASCAPAEAMVEPLAGNYFVAVYPPFSAWRRQSRDLLASLHECHVSTNTAWGLYVHIPFCERRCNYCYYLSFAGTPRSELANYVRRVVQEAALYAELRRFANRPPRFVYFG